MTTPPPAHTQIHTHLARKVTQTEASPVHPITPPSSANFFTEHLHPLDLDQTESSWIFFNATLAIMTLYFVIYYWSDHCFFPLSLHHDRETSPLVYRMSLTIQFFLEKLFFCMSPLRTPFILFLTDDVSICWLFITCGQHKRGDGLTQWSDKQPQRVALLWFVYIQQWRLHRIKVSGSRVDRPLKQPIRGWLGI